MDFSPVPVIFVGSVVYLISSVVACNEASDWSGKYAWAFSCGFISTIFSGAMVFLQGTGRGELLVKNQKHISIFFFIWWSLGAGIGTFEGPFLTSGNGYFAAWICFFGSLKYGYSVSAKIKNFTDRAMHAMMDHPTETYEADKDPSEAYA